MFAVHFQLGAEYVRKLVEQKLPQVLFSVLAVYTDKHRRFFSAYRKGSLNPWNRVKKNARGRFSL
jgi:hypothetical protein